MKPTVEWNIIWVKPFGAKGERWFLDVWRDSSTYGWWASYGICVFGLVIERIKWK